MRRKKTYIDENGYRRFTDSGKLVHRWVAEKHIIDDRLQDDEVVHHIDGNKLNNDPDNLEVMRREDHIDLHEEQSPGWKARHGIRDSSAGCSGILAWLLWFIGSIVVLLVLMGSNG